MNQFSLLTVTQLSELYNNKKTTDEDKFKITEEIERRTRLAEEERIKERAAKELKLQEMSKLAEEKKQKEYDESKRREAWLQTDEGKEQQRIDQLNKEEEEKQRILAEEKTREKQRLYLQHVQYIKEEFDDKEASEILDKEQIKGHWLTQEELANYRKGSDKWAHMIEIVDQKHPDFQSMYKQYTRAIAKKLPTAEDALFISKFNEKFRNETNNAIQNSLSTTNNTAMISAGTNENDVAIVKIQEDVSIQKLALKQNNNANKLIFELAKFQSTELQNARMHNLALEKELRKSNERMIKQQNKHSENLEKIRNRSNEVELKLHRQKRKYAKKHPFVAALDGGAKTVEKVMDSIQYVMASPEDKAKLELERQQKKTLKRHAEDANIQNEIDKRAEEKARALAEEMVRKILEEKGVLKI
jgi:hypothetical protein